jgi:putative ABC transport system permease protein
MYPDLQLLGYASGLILVTSVVCGVMPAIRATKKDGISQLQVGGPAMPARLWARHALTITQVTVSVMLLVISLLFVRTLVRLTTLNTGVDLDHGIVATVELQPGRYSREGAVLAAGRLLERVKAIPGVRYTSIADILPRAQDGSASRFETEGASGPGARTFLNSVGPHYFETMGISVLRGREFQVSDRIGAPGVVIVNQAFATAYFPDADPIGERVREGKSDAYEIVGVVQNSDYQMMGEVARPLLYYAYGQRPVSTQYRPLRIHMRTAGVPSAMLRTVREIVSNLDRDAPVQVTTLRDATSFESDARRTITLLFVSLGMLGLVLAMVGLYGTISYLVAATASETGVRIALGASSTAVLCGVLRHGLKLTATGMTIGIALSLIAGRLLTAVLAGLSPADPVAFGVSALILIVVAVGASFMPAWRATRVDPMVALRAE